MCGCHRGGPITLAPLGTTSQSSAAEILVVGDLVDLLEAAVAGVRITALPKGFPTSQGV